MRCYFAIAAGLALTACAAAMLARGPSGSDLTDVTLELQQVSPDPLPFQAVRVRLTIRNGGPKPVGPLPALLSLDWPKVKELEQKEFVTRWFGGSTAGIETSAAGTYPLCSFGRITTRPVYLAKGEHLAVSIVLPMIRGVKTAGGPSGIGAPKPGSYSVKYNCPIRVEDRANSVEQTFELRVRKPSGVDAAVFERLEKDLALVSALSGGVPKWALVPALQEIVEKHPTSSYADYARLALAQRFLAEREGNVPAAEYLEPICFYREDKQRKKLVTGYFAYQPRALILMTRANPKRAREALAHLDRHFTDSREWIEERARILASGSHLDKPAQQFLGVRFAGPLDPKPPVDASGVEPWEAFRLRLPEPLEKDLPPAKTGKSTKPK